MLSASCNSVQRGPSNLLVAIYRLENSMSRERIRQNYDERSHAPDPRHLRRGSRIFKNEKGRNRGKRDGGTLPSGTILICATYCTIAARRPRSSSGGASEFPARKCTIKKNGDYSSRQGTRLYELATQNGMDEPFRCESSSALRSALATSC